MLEEPINNARIDGATATIIAAAVAAIALILREYLRLEKKKSLTERRLSHSQVVGICERYLIPFLGRTSEIVERGHLQPGDSSFILEMIGSPEIMKLDRRMVDELFKLKKTLCKSPQNCTPLDKLLLFVRGTNIQELMNMQVMSRLRKIHNLYDEIYRPLYTGGSL